MKKDDLNLEKSVRWVNFGIGSELFAVNVLQVQEVQKLVNIAIVPGSPMFVMGIINLRGNVVTIIDAGLRLGLPGNETTELTRIIILDAGDKSIGLKIDRVYEVVSVPKMSIFPAPKVSNLPSDQYVKGVAHHNDQLVLLLDVEKLISESDSSVF